jgi:hypothetical protein
MKLNEEIRMHQKEVPSLLKQYQALISSAPCQCSRQAYAILKTDLKTKVYDALLREHFPSLSTKKLLQLGILGILLRSPYLKIKFESLSGGCELCGARSEEIVRIVDFRPEDIIVCKSCGRKLNLVEGFFFLKVIISEEIAEEARNRIRSVLSEVLESEEDIKNSLCVLGSPKMFRRAIDLILGVWNGSRFFLVKRLLIKEYEYPIEEVLLGLAE